MACADDRTVFYRLPCIAEVTDRLDRLDLVAQSPEVPRVERDMAAGGGERGVRSHTASIWRWRSFATLVTSVVRFGRVSSPAIRAATNVTGIWRSSNVFSVPTSWRDSMRSIGSAPLSRPPVTKPTRTRRSSERSSLHAAGSCCPTSRRQSVPCGAVSIAGDDPNAACRRSRPNDGCSRPR